MAIDKKYVDQILKVSEKAALASSYLSWKKRQDCSRSSGC